MSKKLTILAIDDEAVYLRLIKLFLSLPQYEVVTIEGGMAGMEYLNDNTDISLVLLDLMMPDIDGFDVLRFIKHHPALKQVPVIIQTATPNEEDIDDGLKLGATTCIRKPYTINELQDTVKEAI